MELKNRLANLIIAVLPQSIKRRIIVNSISDSVQIYSQEGEDRLIERFVGQKTYGIYVDIGAHHPTLLSNTYYFYKKGWRGINVDAMPGSMKPFEELRPYDINVEQPIADVKGTLDFHIFSSPELNTFDAQKIPEFLTFPGVTLLDKIKLQTITLAELLEQQLPKLGNPQIDFLSVDVEGFDLKVLQSNNWDKFRPDFILAEDLFTDIMGSYNNPVCQFLMSKGYQMKAKTYNTVIFQKNG